MIDVELKCHITEQGVWTQATISARVQLPALPREGDLISLTEEGCAYTVKHVWMTADDPVPVVHLNDWHDAWEGPEELLQTLQNFRKEGWEVGPHISYRWDQLELPPEGDENEDA